jgi:hypothetical protein
VLQEAALFVCGGGNQRPENEARAEVLIYCRFTARPSRKSALVVSYLHGGGHPEIR